MNAERQFRAKLTYCEYKNSSNGQACLLLVMERKMERRARGRIERFEIELSVARSDVGDLVRGVRRFMRQERDTIKALSDYVGVES